jgi:hypothetical protein
MDELGAHFPLFCRLAYRDRETAQAISRIVCDFVERYADIDSRIDAGQNHDDAGLAATERALAWDLRVIRKWSPSIPPRRVLATDYHPGGDGCTD